MILNPAKIYIKILFAKKKGAGGKTDENGGHYVIASSRLPERRTLVPKKAVDKSGLML